jgi:hypothetical protein
MPDMLAWCQWLQEHGAGNSIRRSLWLFPAIETIHLLGMATLIATVGFFDLRLLGWAMREEPVSQLSRRLLPWTWIAFAVQVVTGSLLFSSEAVKVYLNPAFRLKLLLILLAGLQALFFEWNVRRNGERWSQGLVPISAKFAACLSILLWMGVVAAGRFIGFV